MLLNKNCTNFLLFSLSSLFSNKGLAIFLYEEQKYYHSIKLKGDVTFKLPLSQFDRSSNVQTDPSWWIHEWEYLPNHISFLCYVMTEGVYGEFCGFISFVTWQKFLQYIHKINMWQNLDVMFCVCVFRNVTLSKLKTKGNFLIYFFNSHIYIYIYI